MSRVCPLQASLSTGKRRRTGKESSYRRAVRQFPKVLLNLLNGLDRCDSPEEGMYLEQRNNISLQNLHSEQAVLVS